ncbi:MAG: ACP S-malonyltransferase [Janthinobacterium lividum]
MKIAYIFPGQGSQAVGMGQNLCAHSEAARTVFEQADEYLGSKISTLCFYGPEEALKQTIHTQPALYVTSVAVLSALKERGVPAPEAVAGHSVGEYAALFAAGVFDFETGLHLVERRAQEMHRAALSQPGAMAAVLGLTGPQVVAVCAEAETAGPVSAANFNGGGQVVISGSPEGVGKASELAKAAGAKRVLPLNVSGAFHSALMAPAVEAMEYALRDAVIQPVSIPVIANLTADYETTPDEIRTSLAAQIDHPVRWEETINRLVADRFDTFVEVGSGTVLAGLMKRIAPDVKVYSVGDSAAVEAFAETLGQGL